MFKGINWRWNIHTNEMFLHRAIDLIDNVLHGTFHGHKIGIRGVRNMGDNDDYYITLYGATEKELDFIIDVCNYGDYEIDEWHLRKTIHLEPYPKS